MSNAPQILAVLDANVLYPALLRDFLLNLAMRKIYTPKWSDKINEEWTRNLLLKRSDLEEKNLLSVVSQMNIVFPFSKVKDYESLIPSLDLPDPDDRHVLAAAIKAKATIITTANLRDFPKEYIQQFNIEILHPDEFVLLLLKSVPQKCLQAFHVQVAKMKNPKQTEEQVLSGLEKSGLAKSVEILRLLLSQE